MLDQKFEVLTNLLGVNIVAAYRGQDPQPFVKSTRDNGLLASAQEYIGAVVTAEKLLSLHFKMLKQQKDLLSEIDWRVK